jgi:hypothetical protein
MREGKEGLVSEDLERCARLMIYVCGHWLWLLESFEDVVFTGDDDPDSNLGSASHIYARSANAFVSVHEVPKADLRTAVSSVSSCPGVVFRQTILHNTAVC